MFKKLIVICLLFFLVGCFPGPLIKSVIDISKLASGKSYGLMVSKIKFKDFSPEEEITTSDSKYYLIQQDKKNKYIAFVTGEDDEDDCLVGVKIQRDNFDADMSKLNDFLIWSRLAVDERKNSYLVDGNKNNISYINEKKNHQPLMVYSGKTCGIFAKTKYYAVNAKEVEKMIETAAVWQLEITNTSKE